jgi:hypothetical protein
MITTSSQPISSVTTNITNSTSNSSHPPSLLANNDRTGIDFLFIEVYYSFNEIN